MRNFQPRTVAVRHQVDGIEATIGQQHHPDSLGEGLLDGIEQFAAVCAADHAAAMRQGLPSQGNRAAVEDEGDPRMPFPKTGGVQGEGEFGKRQAAQGQGVMGA